MLRKLNIFVVSFIFVAYRGEWTALILGAGYALVPGTLGPVCTRVSLGAVVAWPSPQFCDGLDTQTRAGRASDITSKAAALTRI